MPPVPITALLGLLLVEANHILHVLLGTQEYGQTLVDTRRLNIQNPLGTGRGQTASLFRQVGHREGFVQDSQLSVRALLVTGVTKDSSVE